MSTIDHLRYLAASAGKTPEEIECSLQNTAIILDTSLEGVAGAAYELTLRTSVMSAEEMMHTMQRVVDTRSERHP